MTWAERGRQVHDLPYGYNSFENANILQGDVKTYNADEWGIERVSATAFNVWDKIP